MTENSIKISPNETEKKDELEEKDIKTPLSPEEKEARNQDLVASIFFGLIIMGLFVSIIGAVWSIADIFSTNKFASFLELSVPSKLFIIGIILLGLFIMSIFFLVLYRRGKIALLKSLFKEKPTQKNLEEYLPAKIIAAGTLISFCVIFLGLIIALIEYIITRNSVTDPSGTFDFLTNLSGGSLVLVIGLIFLALTGLALGMVYSWQQGYYFFMKIILRSNEKYKSSLNLDKVQKIIGIVIFAIFVVNLILIMLGVIWAIIDAAVLDWGNTFRSYPFGIQFSIMGLFGTGLFALLILAMMAYKWGNIVITTAIFGKFQPKVMDKENKSAKIIALGMLIAITLIAISFILWLISLAAGAISGDDVGNLFIILGELSGGLSLMAWSIVVLVFLILGLVFMFSLNNGYYVVMSRILKLTEVIDDEFEILEVRSRRIKHIKTEKKKEKQENKNNHKKEKQ